MKEGNGMNCKFNYAGKTVLITGAGSGTGLSAAKAFLKAGAVVAMNDINKKLLEDAKENLQEYKERLLIYPCDVTNSVQTDSMLQFILNKTGRLDILINNAGIIMRSPLLETEETVFRKELEIDLLAPFQLAKKTVPYMIKQGGGKIINMCSVMSDIVRENASTYAAAKGGLKMLTRGMAVEWGKYNIQCNGVAPGYIETEQTAPIRDGNPEFYNFICNRTAAGRWGRTQDITGIILFLASEEAGYITGQIVYADGGMMIYVGKK